LKVKEIRQKFQENLKSYFPETEIESFVQILFEKYVGFSRLDLVLNPEFLPEKHQLQQLESALNRLKNQEPIQYIVGETSFFGLTFKVNSHVLIPRPETEELVDWVLKDISDSSDSLSILDIGTGSGCIAISIASKTEDAEVFAWDISEEALRIAEQNASLNQVEVIFEMKNILDSEISTSKKLDIIISNPPYVRQKEKQKMNANVLDFEPHVALFVEDNDALIFYRKILDFAKNHIKAGGRVYFEINEYLKSEMEDLLQSLKLHDYTFKKDIFGKNRMLRVGV